MQIACQNINGITCQNISVQLIDWNNSLVFFEEKTNWEKKNNQFDLFNILLYLLLLIIII